jgi:protocatechuate 3,4-dioxygenase beta subunit
MTPHESLTRRRALAVLGGGALAGVLGACGDDDAAPSSASTSPSTTEGAAGATSAIPEETAGPFPGDGSNGPNVLTEDGVVRQDITSSFGSSSGSADGVPLAIELKVVSAASGAPVSGTAVYAWHCDREGRYSLYSQGVEDQNYLRGVQEAAGDGTLRFDSIFPGAYPGRWPHVHFEVYLTLVDATSGALPAATSQLAFPQDVCEEVYATAGYEASARSLSQTSLTSDLVFADGVDQQLATMTGDATAGYVARLTVPI